MSTPLQTTFDLTYEQRDGNTSDFIIAESNRAAVEWLQRYPEWPGVGLVIYGPVGSGKSHLARAWGLRTAAMDINNVQDIIDYLGADCLQPVVVDPADEFCSDPANAEQMFHLYQRLEANGAKMIMLSIKPPQQWDIPLADLASRVRSLPLVDMHLPDDDLVATMLMKYFNDRGIMAEPEVIKYLAERAPRSGPELQALVADIDKDSLQTQRKLSLAGVRAYCKEKLGK